MTGNKRKKKPTLLIIIIAIIVLIAIAVFRPLGARNAAINGYEVIEVTRQDMQTTVRGSGVVESNNKLDVYAPMTIAIEEVYVENGDEVTFGTPIAKIDKDMYLDAEKAIEDSILQIDDSIKGMYNTAGDTYIYSPVKGIVKEINTAPDDSIEVSMNKYGVLIVISADGNMKVELKVDEVQGYEEGDNVIVKVGDEKVDAVITEVDIYESVLKIVFTDNKYTDGEDIEVYDENNKKIGNANMQINVPVYVNGDAGLVRYLYVDVNASVEKGTRLLRLKENDASGELISLTEQREKLVKQLEEMQKSADDIGLGEDYIIYSKGEGIIDELILAPYFTAAEGTKIFTVQSTSPLMMSIEIDELDIAHVKTGQIVELKFDALSQDVYQGEIVKINSLGQSVNGVTRYTIKVVIEETGNILIGMSGNAKIRTDEKKNVITVPVEAVQLIDDEYYVIMGEDANIKTIADHKITAGLNDGAYIEVVEGLTDGDTIAMPLEEGLEVAFGPGRR